jgi:hypothetical protein
MEGHTALSVAGILARKHYKGILQKKVLSSLGYQTGSEIALAVKRTLEICFDLVT